MRKRTETAAENIARRLAELNARQAILRAERLYQHNLLLERWERNEMVRPTIVRISRALVEAA